MLATAQTNLFSSMPSLQIYWRDSGKKNEDYKREREKEYIGNTAVKSRGTSLNLQKRQNSNSFSTTYVIKRHKV